MHAGFRKLSKHVRVWRKAKSPLQLLTRVTASTPRMQLGSRPRTSAFPVCHYSMCVYALVIVSYCL